MRKLLFPILLLIILAGAAYTAVWHFIATKITEETVRWQATAAASGFVVNGGFGEVTGFPKAPALAFSGSVTREDLTLEVPTLRVQGFPFPGRVLVVVLPRGVSLQGKDGTGAEIDREIWSLDEMRLEGPVPAVLPASFTVEGLREWRENGGVIEFNSFFLRKESLKVSGKGALNLDSDLQPAGQFDVKVSGHAAFLGFLEEKKLIESKQAAISGAILNGLSRHDEETGELVVQAALTVQNSTILLGPVSLAELPVISWDY